MTTMPYEDYAKIEAWNWSRLKHLEESPRMLRHRLEVERRETAALRRGSAIHCAALEPERWGRYVVEPDADGRTNAGKAVRAKWLLEVVKAHGDTACVALPDFGDLRKKGPKLLKENFMAAAAAEGKYVITGREKVQDLVGHAVEVVSAEDHELAERCAKSLREHPVAAEMISGVRHEEVITWTDAGTGLPCKARLDVTGERVVDLKSTRHRSIRRMEADAARLLYHGQLAFYHDGAIACGALPKSAPEPVLLFVQTVEPYDVVPGCLSEWDLNAGRALYQKLLRRLQRCEAADWWPGLAPDLVELDLPDWAAAGDPEDLEGAGDDVGF